MQVGPVAVSVGATIAVGVGVLTLWSEVNYVFSRANKIVNGTDDGP